jgi:hypothetical protein
MSTPSESASSRWQPFARGAAAAAATIGVSLLLGRDAALGFYAIVLGATAGVYLGFAALDGRRRELGLEIAGIVFFVLLALAGLQGRPHVLALGFFLHILWDYAHHPRGLQTRIIGWYPPACVAYDGLVGAFLLVWWR